MKTSKVLPIVLGLGFIILSVVLILFMEPEQAENKTITFIRQPVSIVMVTAQDYQQTITMLGFTRVRWPVDIKSKSEGKVVWLSTLPKPGAMVKKGDILAKLSTSDLRSTVAEVYGELKQAELNLLRQQHEQTVALKMLLNKKASAYARREPQLALAKALLSQAQEAYLSAKQHLDDATITAPFDAVILDSIISPGQHVVAGQLLFELAASDSLDVHLPVPDLQWASIAAALEQPKLRVIDRQDKSWPASIRYVAPQADETTRQRQVVLAVNQPYQGTPKLRANQQVKVDVILAMKSRVTEIPLSSMTRDGQVWTVDNDDKLSIEFVTLVDETQHHAYVIFDIEPQQKRRVVVYPLLSMLPGVQVLPQSVVLNSLREQGAK